VTNTVRAAVFRPADDRLDDAVALLESLGADPVADPMLAVDPTERAPRADADYVVFTSKTGVELAADRGWEPAERTAVVAIGDRTASTLDEAGYAADLVPETYSSAGLVSLLADKVPGARVEVARSDHGSDVLLDGLVDAGGYVHETVLYELTLPADAGRSTARAAEGALDAALFTSSLTVEHFLEAARQRGIEADAIDGLGAAVVGAIGEPTRETATARGIDVDIVPDRADFETLACAVVEAASPSYSE
jgi:uroporphyrinogen-III synthase